MTTSRPAVLIGLDAAEVRVIEALMTAGRLPNLAALRAQGAWGRVRNEPLGFLSMVWPSFVNGTRVGQHGWYYGKMWRPEHMRLEYADSSWLAQGPFWEDLAGCGLRTALVDIPYSMGAPTSLDGIYLNGWQSHDDFGRHVHPRGLWKELAARFGKPKLQPEWFGPQSGQTLQRLRAEILAGIDQVGQICEYLLARETWDLFAVVIGGVHRGGHYLWDLSQIDAAALADDEHRILKGAHQELYIEADRAVGRILARAPADARVMVFALHGMGPNTGWTEVFPRLIEQIHRGSPGGARQSGLLYRAKKALPWQLVREVTTRLPTSVNHRLMSIWSRRMYEWSTTRFFPLPVDLNGFVRINLRGREAEGVVAPGKEYADVLRELENAFASFRDLETNQSIAAAIERIDDLVGADAPRRRYLPDLCVCWSDCIAMAGVGVGSPTYGDLRWERGARLASGRSGNHMPDGWLIAAGAGIAPGATLDAHETIDLTPTLFAWLAQPAPARFEGRAIPGLTGVTPAVREGVDSP